MLDVNHFREFNAPGHDAGDDLLRLIAGEAELRTVTPEPLFLGRFGSDEFALVMRGRARRRSPAAAQPEQLRAVGRTVLEQIRGPFRVNGAPVEAVRCRRAARRAIGSRRCCPAPDAALGTARSG